MSSSVGRIWTGCGRRILCQTQALTPRFHLSKPAGARSTRLASSSSSAQWQARQTRDKFGKAAKVQGLKSRAAFKLLEINEKHKVFRNGQTVVDLGYAPGSWSQVAVDRTSPNGRVVGIDIIPAQPPKGVSTLQGNFLSPAVQQEVKRFLRDSKPGRAKEERSLGGSEHDEMTADDRAEQSLSYLEREKMAEDADDDITTTGDGITAKAEAETEKRTVDVVLSDMSAPWAQTDGFWKRSLSNPYYRMMNTSGNGFRDHAGSMDLCNAALRFAFDMLRPGGHFVCKYYQGSEDKQLEKKLKTLFRKVHREKPESSRSESREGYFVALRRIGEVDRGAVFPISESE